MDTQWPRFYVFKQNSSEDVHKNCGTIHAADAEMALLNARDVFVRRPPCHSLWVVPATSVLSLTAEQLERAGQPRTSPVESDEPATYHVFTKTEHRERYARRGELLARGPQDALHLALNEYPPESHIAWRVMPASAVVTTSEDDIAAWFDPAADKHYRHPGYYHTDSMMREIKSRELKPEGDGDEG